MNHDCKRIRIRRQGGATAVEFAFVLPVLLLLLYGMTAYAYLFVIQQSITFAAQEAAESAVAVAEDEDGGSDATRISNARQMAVSVLNWLPAEQKNRVLGDGNGSAVSVTHCAAGSGSPCPSDSDAVIVSLTFNLNSPGALFPSVSLLGLVNFPPMPAALVATAVARV